METKGIRVYPTLDVTLTYQNFGSAWLGILRGPTEQIERAFNGLFNLGGANGEHEFQDHLSMLTLFWTSKKGLRRFFFNRYFLARVTSWRGNLRLARAAMRFAQAQVSQLRETGHEAYLNFGHRSLPEIYTCGQLTAEKPDVDMKDAILMHAFQHDEPASASPAKD